MFSVRFHIVFYLVAITLCAYYSFSILFLIYLISQYYSPRFEEIYLFFTSTYGGVALFGSMIGLLGSKAWGGYKSAIGRGLFFLSTGLFLQFVGQATYSYYLNILETEPPYPSIAEFAFLTSQLFYLFSAWQFTKVTNISSSIKFTGVKIISVIAGLASFSLAILYFINNHETLEEFSLTIIMLEIAYPALQAAYICLSIICLYLLKNLMGGKILKFVAIILVGLISQYVADSIFLWVPTLLSDVLYLLSYGCISLGMLLFTNLVVNSYFKLGDAQQNGS